MKKKWGTGTGKASLWFDEMNGEDIISWGTACNRWDVGEDRVAG